MFPKLFPLIMIATFISITSCSKRKVHYECQCYKDGTFTQSYEIGRMADKDVPARCISVQESYGQDTCYGSGRLK